MTAKQAAAGSKPCQMPARCSRLLAAATICSIARIACNACMQWFVQHIVQEAERRQLPDQLELPADGPVHRQRSARFMAPAVGLADAAEFGELAKYQRNLS